MVAPPRKRGREDNARSSSRRARVSIPKGQSVAFVGSTHVRVVSGAVRVFGVLLEPSPIWTLLHSPAGGVALSLDAVTRASVDLHVGELDTGQVHRPSHVLHAAAENFAASLMSSTGLQQVAEGAIPSTWQHGVAGVVGQLQLAPTVLVCGGRNTGKSTLVRYVVNSALENWDKVYLLDVDVGQHELGPPGFLSLHAVGEPLLGPAHTHALSAFDPVAAVYFGDVNPASDPQAFLGALRALADHAVGRSAPVIVNTCGWVRGLGLELLVEIIRAVKPDQIVNLQSTNLRQNVDLGSRTEVIVSLPGLEARCPGVLAPTTTEARTWQLFTYFAGVITPGFRCDPDYWRHHQAQSRLASALRAQPPLVISHMRVAILEPAVAASETLWALNAAIVGLVAGVEPRGAHCLGLGIVRSIDPQRGLLFVLTPVDAGRLKRVTTLVRGNIHVPTTMLGDAGPYLVLDSETGGGAREMRSRNSLQRAGALRGA